MFARSTFGVAHVVRPPSISLTSNLNGSGFRYSLNIIFRSSGGSAKLVVGSGVVINLCFSVTGPSSVVRFRLSDATGVVGVGEAMVDSITTSSM